MNLAEIREWKEKYRNSFDQVGRIVTGAAIDWLVREVERLSKSRELECKECLQLAALDRGRDGYLQGLERAAVIAEKAGFNHCSCVDRERCASCGAVDEILSDIRAETCGDQSELATLRNLERSYSQQLGEMARLADVVCGWVLKVNHYGTLPGEVWRSADAIMDYVDAVRPPEGSKDPEWVMHILGPDDVIDFPSQFAALRAANEANKAYAKFMADDPSPNNPFCVAIAKNATVEEV